MRITGSNASVKEIDILLVLISLQIVIIVYLITCVYVFLCKHVYKDPSQVNFHIDSNIVYVCVCSHADMCMPMLPCCLSFFPETKTLCLGEKLRRGEMVGCSMGR